MLDPDFYNVRNIRTNCRERFFRRWAGWTGSLRAFEKQVGGLIRYNAEVSSIRNQEQGVAVVYKDKTGPKTVTADLCICTIPLPVLSNIEHNFSSDASRAIDSIVYMSTGKIGLQFKRRFWEEDEGIYGGITHTNNQLTQIFILPMIIWAAGNIDRIL